MRGSPGGGSAKGFLIAFPVYPDITAAERKKERDEEGHWGEQGSPFKLFGRSTPFDQQMPLFLTRWAFTDEL